MPLKCFLLVPAGERIESVPDGTATRSLWKRTDTGEIDELRHFPDGAMWFAPWMRTNDQEEKYDFDWLDLFTPPLIVKCPGGHHWNIDSRASNCASPQDRFHRCWCRHGDAPNITIDKEGKTCGAGGGSIQTGNYHGFLRNGFFVPC